MNIVLVCLGRSNKIPQTGCFTNNRNLFLVVLESGKSEIKVLTVSVSGEELLPQRPLASRSRQPHGVEGSGEGRNPTEVWGEPPGRGKSICVSPAADLHLLRGKVIAEESGRR